MTDAERVAFLQWALPRLGRRWEGYRKVRKRVGRKILHRVEELGLDSLADYREYLEENADEWDRLDALTDVTISRFYRDRAVFDHLTSTTVPALVERAQSKKIGTVRAWSAGCANGEEPYTLAIMWELAVALDAGPIQFTILGTDIKKSVLDRADKGCYPNSSTRDLPAPWRDAAFTPDHDGEMVLKSRFRRNVEFAQHDIRDEPPAGPFDLVLCRYQSFTYFDVAGQRRTLCALSKVTQPGAILVLGSREKLPPDEPGFRELSSRLSIYERCSNDSEPT